MRFPLSNSEVRTFKACRRRWMLTYYRGHRLPDRTVTPDGVVQLGSRVHTALEAHYGYGLDPVDVLDYLYTEAARERPDYVDELRKDHGYAATMVMGYLTWVAENGIDHDYEVVSTERLVTAELQLDAGETVVDLRGKLDQLVRRVSDGAILFRDFKTVGTLAKANLLILDEQMRFYSLLQALEAKGTDQRVDGGLYTMLLRSKRTARATGPFYQQVEVRYNKHDLNSTFLRVAEVAREVAETRRRLDQGHDHRAVAYPNPDQHCTWCPFLSVCPMMDDGSRWEAALENEYVRTDPYAYYGHDTIDQVLKALRPVNEVNEENDQEGA